MDNKTIKELAVELAIETVKVCEKPSQCDGFRDINPFRDLRYTPSVRYAFGAIYPAGREVGDLYHIASSKARYIAFVK